MNVSFGATDVLHTNYLRLYIPDRDKHGDLYASKDWIERARFLFTTCFGGCTTTYGDGMWRNEDTGQYIEEKTAIITAAVSHKRLTTYLITVRRFIQDFIATTHQNAVAIEYNGTMHFVYADARQTRQTQQGISRING